MGDTATLVRTNLDLNEVASEMRLEGQIEVR